MNILQKKPRHIVLKKASLDNVKTALKEGIAGQAGETLLDLGLGQQGHGKLSVRETARTSGRSARPRGGRRRRRRRRRRRAPRLRPRVRRPRRAAAGAFVVAAGLGRRRGELAPLRCELAAVGAAVDLEPAHGVVEVALGRDHAACRAGPVGLAQPPLREQDEPQPLEVAPGERAGEGAASRPVPAPAPPRRRAPRSPRPGRRGRGPARRRLAPPRRPDAGDGAPATRRSGTPSGTSSDPMSSGFVSWSGVARPAWRWASSRASDPRKRLVPFGDGAVGLRQQVGEQAVRRAASRRSAASGPGAGSCRAPRGSAPGCCARSRRAGSGSPPPCRGSIVKSRRAASATARSMRTGSSRKRSAGSPMVRITRAVRSSRPPTQSITEKFAMS